MEQPSPLKDLDHVNGLTWGHLKVVFTAGMGFFTDAYDLFIIGIAVNLFLAKLWQLTALQEGVLTSMAIWTAVVGQLLFGRLGDVLGRKAIYGVEATILSIGAVASALSPNFTWLLASRAVMGLGIGGDYPISSVIASEYAPASSRGRAVSLVFANQGFGIAAAVAVGILSAYYLPPDLAWRVMLGVGAIPPMAVIYFRRKVPETPRFSLLVRGDAREFSKAVKVAVGREGAVDEVVMSEKTGIASFFKDYAPVIIGTTVPWFLMDVALYGTGIFSSPITSAMLGASKAVWVDVLKSGLPLLVGIPGYFIAAALIDSAGRRPLQIAGFVGAAAAYLLLGLGSRMVGHTVEILIPALAAYAAFSLAFLFINVGPNTTTFVLPSELYPVRYRTTGHGIAAASGKVGAGIATLLLPTLLYEWGLSQFMIVLAALMLVGAGVTYGFVPEPARKPLEEVSKERLVRVPAPQPPLTAASPRRP